MNEPRIQQQFFDSADLKYAAAETLTRSIGAAAQAIVACVTAGGRVLACGHGRSALEAQRFVAAFVAGFERERPALQALALSTDLGLFGGPGAAGTDAEQLLARQVLALGHPGDLLLTFCAGEESPDVLAAVQAAHDKDMAVIALTGSPCGRLGAALLDTDVHIAVPHERATRVQEAHVLIVHALCDAVDLQLLGDHEA